MEWKQLLTTERHGHAAISRKEMGRSHFHKDHDRIVFSSAFRKLTGKTQVHPLSVNDQIHTRLIHSVEVGSVGRSLGIKAGEKISEHLPDWIQPDDVGVIVQSACLAHDIGNPPFGHAGEFAIQDWFRQPTNQVFLEGLSERELQDLQTFEGNAQGFRIVTQLERNLFEGGMRLTYPTLGAMLKYPWLVNHAGQRRKFSCFQSEQQCLEELADKLGLKTIGDGAWARHPLSYLMEAADDICYAIIDLEDAVELQILSYDEVRPIMQTLCQDRWKDLNLDRQSAPHRKLAALRGRAMQAIIDAIVDTFMEYQAPILAGEFEGDLISVSMPHVVDGMQAAKNLAHQKVFKSSAKTETEIGAYAVLNTLLNAFIPAGQELYQQNDMASLSYRTQKILDLLGHDLPDPNASLYQIYQRFLDHITAFTDNYASYLARQVGGTAHVKF